MKSSFGRSFSVFAGILLVALTVLGGSFQMMVQNYLTETSFTRLEQDAAIIQNLAACLDENSMSSREFLMNLDVAAKVSGSDAVICNTKGKVVICSDGTADCGHKGLYVNRDYLNKVIEQGGDRATGIIKGLYEDERFLVSSPITNEDGQNLGILIVSSPLAGVNAVLTKISNIFLTIAAFVVLASVAAVSVFARRESKPLQEMAKVANAFGHGNLEARVKIEESYSEEVEELALAFNNMASSLQKSEYRRQEFVANVSHELKTPLTAISGYAELIENGMISSDDEIRRMAGEIHNNSGRLITLINDVIRLSELDEEQDEILEKVPLSVVAQSSVKMLQINAEKHHVTLTFEGEDAFIWGTRQMVDEVVYNLCDNAIRYNKENGSVSVRVYRENGRAVLQVQDTGIGIPQECQERIFERFYRVDKGRSKLTGGTGLGLAIVKHILMRLKGELKLVSTPGQGTIITIAFPSCEEDTDR